MSVLPALLVLFGGLMKLLLGKQPMMVESFAKYGLPESEMVVIGILEIVCPILYLIPRTSVLGAILMTGLMGGATQANVRIGHPAGVVTVLVGMMVWGGLYLRDPRVRALIPLRGE